MHRIYQSRRKLTASIASATIAEDRLLEAASATNAEGGILPSSLSQTDNNERKRQLEDVIDNDENDAESISRESLEQSIGKTDSASNGQGTASTSSSPPHKKTAIHRSPEATISTSTAQTSAATATTLASSPIASITPINDNVAASSNSNNTTLTPLATVSESAIATDGDAVTSFSPDRMMVAIDLRTPCPSSPQRIVDAPDSEVSVVDPPPAKPAPIHPEATAGGKRDDNHNDDEQDEEIQVVSSTTVNPNIQYPHKRINCGVHEFSIDPKSFCDKCYCSTCDIPAKDCAQWEDHHAREGGTIGKESCSLDTSATALATPNPSVRTVTMDTTEDGEDGKEADIDEEEIQVVSSTTVNPNIQYPHKRTDCGVFDFSKHPSKFCDKCYCIVCDIPAKDCTQWADHSFEKCRPATSFDENMTDDEGYDVTDEILLESPSTTARDYYDRQRGTSLDPQILEEQARDEAEEIRRQMARHEHDGKLKITDVLSKKLRTALEISDGGRMQMSEVDSSNSSNKDEKPTKESMEVQKNAMEGDIPQLGLHSSFFVEGIKIGWPFPAIMLPQRQMAIHIIKGLKRKLHVVLESPTGTGKSVAILCSVLAWQRYHMQTTARAPTNTRKPRYGHLNDDSDEEEKDPKIIYCSRTHSQVAQMVASLKKTPYRPVMTVLGSRERMCIHKQLTGENKKKNKVPINLACQMRRQNTESDRKRRIKEMEFNDDDPTPHDEINGDDIGEGEVVANEDSENPIDDGTGRRKTKPPTCPHYRQLSSQRIASMTAKQLMGGHRIRSSNNGGCCGSTSAVGGEESIFGVHDMEDLVHFGKNPYKEENIAVYRGRSGKFGFLINDNVNELGEAIRGCHVESLVPDGAAVFEARLQEGDKILKVNGRDVRTWNKRKVVDFLRQLPKDEPARLNVLRECSDTPELLNPELDLVGAQDTDHPEEIYSEHSACPYYLSRAIQVHSELTFAPYNYILDPGIRRVMGISLKNAVVVLDEAHNVESTLCEGGSGKYGEMDLFQLVCTLSFYARRTTETGNITLIDTQEEVDSAKLAHDLLIFVEKIVFHMQALRQRFETSPGRQKLEDDYKRYHNTPDNHEVELSYDGPTGYGIKGAAVGCQPFLSRLDITKERCTRLLQFASSMEQTLFGGKSESQGDNQADNVAGESSNVLTILVELLSKLITATKNPEHYYISCIVQANGNLDHAFGIDDEENNRRGAGSRRFKKKPRTVPFISPRTVAKPNAFLPVCQHDECRAHTFFGEGVRHGDYCNGSTPPWECHLVLRLLSPGLLMREISQECRSVILASGSLAPLPSVCAELNLFGKDSSSSASTPHSLVTRDKLPTISQSLLDSIVGGHLEKLYTNRLQTTPKPLEANHVVNLQKQLLAVSIGHFPTGEKLTVSYSNYHNNPNFLPKFGHAVASVLDGVPKGGCLIFFPSYSFLNKCVSCWNQQSYNSSRRHRYFGNSGATQDNNNFVWERFLRSKGKVIVEPTGGQEDFEAARDEYRETIRETGSCILLAVFRGKMSEGIDFNDENARAVICIGMPLPNWTDRSVKAKQAYNDEQRKLCNNTSLLPGRDYYSQQAYRAISQALGRCIRHGADYGTVILMDSRHCYDGSPLTSGNGGVCRAHSNLPKWMRGSVHTLSMEAEDRRVVRNTGRQQPNMIYGGYAGLKREMRQFFARAPIVSREVRDKWKADREKVISASSRTSNMVFHRDTGNWTTLQEALSQQGDSGDIEELPRKGSIQI